MAGRVSAPGPIYVVGGSNSVLGGGWLPRFRALMPKGTPIHNLAIGGATSLMGLFRLETAAPIGGTLIWEYALNEFGHHRQGGHPIPVLLRHLRLLLASAAARSLTVIPLIFTTRGQERAPGTDAYRTVLTAEFADLGLTTLDVSSHFRRKFDIGHLPDSDYQNNFHYMPDGRIVNGIAEWLHEHLSAAPQVAPMALPMKARLQGGLPTGGGRYETRLVGLDVTPFDTGITFVADGDLLGMALVTSANAGAVELLVDGKPELVVSTRSRPEQTGPNRLLKQISFEGLLGAPIRAAGRPVTLRRAQGWDNLHADLNYMDQIAPPQGAYEDALAGVIVEVPA